MPGPESAIVAVTVWSDTAVVNVSVPVPFMAWVALVTRFTNACRSWSGKTSTGRMARIGFVDHNVFHFNGGLCRGQHLVQYLLHRHRYVLVEGLTVCHAGKITNDRRHATAMGHDVSGAGLDLLQILLVLNRFPQPDDPEQGIVEFVADSSR